MARASRSSARASSATTPLGKTGTTTTGTRANALEGGGGARAVRLSGGALASAPSGAFAVKDTVLVTPARWRVRAHDAATGRGVRSSEAPGAEQTCAAASPFSSGVVVTGSASGTLTVWDAETGKVVRSYTFPCAIYDVVYPGGEAGKDAIFVSASAREDGGGRVYRVSPVSYTHLTLPTILLV